jgi:hypothetical protein
MHATSFRKGGSRLGAERKVAAVSCIAGDMDPGQRIRLPVSPLSISYLSSLSSGFAEAWRRALK